MCHPERSEGSAIRRFFGTTGAARRAAVQSLWDRGPKIYCHPEARRAEGSRLGFFASLRMTRVKIDESIQLSRFALFHEAIHDS